MKAAFSGMVGWKEKMIRCLKRKREEKGKKDQRLETKIKFFFLSFFSHFKFFSISPPSFFPSIRRVSVYLIRWEKISQ